MQPYIVARIHSKFLALLIHTDHEGVKMADPNSGEGDIRVDDEQRALIDEQRALTKDASTPVLPDPGYVNKAIRMFSAVSCVLLAIPVFSDAFFNNPANAKLKKLAEYAGVGSEWHIWATPLIVIAVSYLVSFMVFYWSNGFTKGEEKGEMMQIFLKNLIMVVGILALTGFFPLAMHKGPPNQPSGATAFAYKLGFTVLVSTFLEFNRPGLKAFRSDQGRMEQKATFCLELIAVLLSGVTIAILWWEVGIDQVPLNNSASMACYMQFATLVTRFIITVYRHIYFAQFTFEEGSTLAQWGLGPVYAQPPANGRTALSERASMLKSGLNYNV